MHIGAQHWLQVWEQGRLQVAPRRALLLLGVARPEAVDQLAGLPIGERNRRLMALRQALFGDALNSVSTCPRCGERLELSLNLSDLLAQAAPEASRHLSLEGYEVEFRLPCSQDLLGLPASTEAARAGLLERIVLEARYQGQEVRLRELPEHVVAALSEALSQADPLAVTEIEMACPNCGHGFSALFDIVSFLWRELEHWAMRTLGEVHRLASAYGWRESDILSLSPLRRQMYLQLVP